MKSLRTTVLCICCAFIASQSFAQTSANDYWPDPDLNKPKLFNDLPEKIDFSPSSLSYLLDTKVSQQVSFTIAAIAFTGQVVSVADSPDGSVKSVVIKLSNRPGARFSFARINNAGTISYTGRILSMQHGDAYELIAENGQYAFKKKTFYDIVSE